jgi:hypothetical protein
MPVLPKPISVLRATWQTARMARRLERTNTAVPAQAETLTKLLEQIANSTYGRDLGISATMNYAEFRSRVPIRDYDQLEPYFRRIKRGEPNVLWPGHTLWFTESAGTTAKPKWLPVTEALADHFSTTAAAAMLYYTARVGDAGIFRGRRLCLAPFPRLNVIPPPELSGRSAPPDPLAVTPSGGWGYDPEDIEESRKDPKELSARIDAMVGRAIHQDVTLISGLPNWLLGFLEAVRDHAHSQKLAAPTLKQLWAKLEGLVHFGIPVAPFYDELRRLAGASVNFHEVYFAAEAFIAAQDGHAGLGLRLIEESGIFFEFLPLAEFNESLPLTLGAKALSLQEVKTEEDYVVLITTPAGLCRYVLGDVIRFVTLEPPRLTYVGRTKLRIDAFDEGVMEKPITDALVTVCQRHGWTITNFHVAPLFNNTLTGQQRGRHEWWVELRPGTAETPTGPILAPQLDAELQVRSAGYALKRKTVLEAPVVRLVMPGFFSHWMNLHDKRGRHQKMPRCRSDREIADELSAVACFNED